MSIRNYSPSDVSVLLAGFYQIDGFVSGSFLTISKDVQPYKTTRTADGTVARTFIKDDTYTITLKIASTSPTNDILTGIVLADSATQYVKFPMFVKDNLGLKRRQIWSSLMVSQIVYGLSKQLNVLLTLVATKMQVRP